MNTLERQLSWHWGDTRHDGEECTIMHELLSICRCFPVYLFLERARADIYI